MSVLVRVACVQRPRWGEQPSVRKILQLFDGRRGAVAGGATAHSALGWYKGVVEAGTDPVLVSQSEVNLL